MRKKKGKHYTHKNVTVLKNILVIFRTDTASSEIQITLVLKTSEFIDKNG